MLPTGGLAFLSLIGPDTVGKRRGAGAGGPHGARRSAAHLFKQRESVKTEFVGV